MLALVHRRFDAVEHLLPLHDGKGVDIGFVEQVAERRAEDLVAQVFSRVDLGQQSL